MDAHVKNHSKEDESKANILNTIDNALNKGAGEFSQPEQSEDNPENVPVEQPEDNPQNVPEEQPDEKPQEEPGKVVKLLRRVSLVCSQRNTLTIWFS